MRRRRHGAWGICAATAAAAVALAAAPASAAPTAGDPQDVGVEASEDGRVDGTEQAAPPWTPANDSVPESEVEARATAEDVSVEEARRRFDVEASAARFQVLAAERYPDTFAGLWLSQQPFRVSMAFTAQPAESVAALADEFSHPELLAPVQQRRSFAQLLAVRDRVAKEREAAAAGGPGASPALAATKGRFDIGLDVRKNVVTVHVPDAAAVRGDLESRYGAAVEATSGVATPSACTTSNCGTTMMSGLQLTQPSLVCSSAFTAYTSSYRYVLSAGHCYTMGGSVTSRSHAGSLYGHTDRYGFAGNHDAERIRRTTSFRESSKYVTNSGDPVMVTSYAAQANVAVGTFVGKTGRTTGTTRGYVTDQYFDPGYVSGTGDRFFVADLCSDQGDSGSGVWRGGAAYGVLSGGWDNQTCRNVNGNLVSLAGAGPTIINGMDTVLSGMQVSLLTNVNLAPAASFTNSCSVLLSCSFSGSSSRDPDGSVRQWSWSFGDNKTGSGASVSHTYALPGNYTVRLTVTDDNGAKSSTSRTILVL